MHAALEKYPVVEIIVVLHLWEFCHEFERIHDFILNLYVLKKNFCTYKIYIEKKRELERQRHENKSFLRSVDAEDVLQKQLELDTYFFHFSSVSP